jgi:serine protease Do
MVNGTTGRLAGRVRLCAALTLTAVLLTAPAACTAALPGLGTRTAAEVFEDAKPAVALVEAASTITWSVPQPVLTPQRAEELRNQVLAMVQAGRVPDTEAEIGQAAVRVLVGEPGAWFSRGAQRHQQTDTVLSLGTGFFVSEDGTLLTSDHVVETSADSLRQPLLAEFQRQAGDPDWISGFQAELSRNLAAAVTVPQAASLFRWALEAYPADLQVASATTTYRVGFGSASPADVRARGLSARVVGQGAPAPGRDVAVLRVSGGPFVSLPVAGGMPARGTALAVVGYPCRCNVATGLDPASVLEPVLSQGSSQGQVSMQGRWSALGTNAAIEHGSSGGPVLDDGGRVVGLAAFTDAAPAPGKPRSFAVPIDVARTFADQAHVQLGQGRLGQDYSQAVAEYRQAQYRAALPLFQQVAAGASGQPYAARYAADSRAAIDAGRDRTPPGLAAALPWVAAAVAAAAVVGAVLWLRRRRRLVTSPT